MKNLPMKLRAKTILLFTVIGSVIIAVMGAVQFFALKNEKLLTIREDVSKQLEHLDFALTRFLKEAENDLLALAANPRVRIENDEGFTHFLDADENTFEYHIGEAESEIITIFNIFETTHPYVNSVYMGRENGNFVRSHKRNRPSAYDPRTRPWYILAKNNTGKVMRTPPYRSVTSPDVNIGIVTALTETDGRVYGVIGIDITLVNLTNYIADFTVSYSGKMILIDEHGSIIASRNREKLFRNVSECFPPGDADRIMKAVPNNVLIETSDGLQVAYVHESTGIGWKLIALIPETEIRDEIGKAVFTTLCTFSVGIMLLSVSMLIALNAYVISPIQKLTESSRYIQQTGDLTHRFMSDAKDEIKELADAFNEMMETIRSSEKELNISRQKLTEQRDNLEERIKERTFELEETNRDLLEEIAERHQAESRLELARDAAEKANRAKSMFLANMSHEIRTPLNAILGFTQILLRDSDIRPAHRTSLETVKRSGEHLLMLLNDILEMSKIESGNLTLNTGDFDLHALIEDLQSMFLVLARNKGLFFETVVNDSVPRWVWSDEHKLRQILNNILGNAIKFTENGGIILRLSAVPEPHRADDPIRERSIRILIEVEDTGPGIPELDQIRIFNYFEQVTIGSKMRGGTGLGLAIAKAYVESMGGTISVQGKVGVGSIFRFDVLADESNEQPSPVFLPSDRRITGIRSNDGEIRILVAEDDDANREMLTQILDVVGFSVQEARNGREACTLFDKCRPNLILMDMKMPEMDGFEAIRTIRTFPNAENLPIIAVTASVLMDDREKVLAIGADDFLSKPYKEDDIFKLLKRFLNIDYIYEDESAESIPNTKLMLDKIPGDILEGLREAAISLDVDRLYELIDQVTLYDGEGAQQLRHCVETYNFSALRERIA